MTTTAARPYANLSDADLSERIDEAQRLLDADRDELPHVTGVRRVNLSHRIGYTTAELDVLRDEQTARA